MLSKLFASIVFALFISPAMIYAAPDMISPDTPVVSAFTKAFGITGDTITSSMGGEGDLFWLQLKKF